MIEDLTLDGPLVAVSLYEYIFEEVALLMPPMDTLAVIDTAAPYTLLQEGIATSLGFTPIETVNITTVSMRVYESYRYHMWLKFPEGNVLEVSVIEVPYMLHPDARVKCKIGRDILRYGVLLYSGCANPFSFDLKVEQ